MSTPTLSIHLDRERYEPGDILVAEWSLRRGTATRDNPIKSWEMSVLWSTLGKGETDIGVHFFERRNNASTESINSPHRLSTVLPASPLSYDGQIFSICWFVRVRLFLQDGQTFTEDYVFQLGKPRFFSPLTDQQTIEPIEQHATD